MAESAMMKVGVVKWDLVYKNIQTLLPISIDNNFNISILGR